MKITIYPENEQEWLDVIRLAMRGTNEVTFSDEGHRATTVFTGPPIHTPADPMPVVEQVEDDDYVERADPVPPPAPVAYDPDNPMSDPRLDGMTPATREAYEFLITPRKRKVHTSAISARFGGISSSSVAGRCNPLIKAGLVVRYGKRKGIYEAL